jgi:hypothetical protein
MTPQLMVQPSSFVPTGVQLCPFGDVCTFKFTDELQTRFETLLDRRAQDLLTPVELAELDGISELSRIFTLLNAQLADRAKMNPAEIGRSPRRPGSAVGKLVILSDDEEHLEDFKDYML